MAQNFESLNQTFWVDPIVGSLWDTMTSYFGRHLENRWVKIIFGAGNEFSDPNYMEKVTSHEKIDLLVVLGSNFDLFWRPFWKYRFSGLMRKNPAWYTAEIDSTHKITPRTGLKSFSHPSCQNFHSCTCLYSPNGPYQCMNIYTLYKTYLHTYIAIWHTSALSIKNWVNEIAYAFANFYIFRS